MKTKLGKAGEAFVTRALSARGWDILARNYRHIGFELDIVARKKSTLIVVEVKTRQEHAESYLRFEDLLPRRKQDSLKKGLIYFLSKSALDTKVARIDLAVVYWQKNKTPSKVSYMPGILEMDGDLF